MWLNAANPRTDEYVRGSENNRGNISKASVYKLYTNAIDLRNRERIGLGANSAQDGQDCQTGSARSACNLELNPFTNPFRRCFRTPQHSEKVEGYPRGCHLFDICGSPARARNRVTEKG